MSSSCAVIADTYRRLGLGSDRTTQVIDGGKTEHDPLLAYATTDVALLDADGLSTATVHRLIAWFAPRKVTLWLLSGEPLRTMAAASEVAAAELAAFEDLPTPQPRLGTRALADPPAYQRDIRRGLPQLEMRLLAAACHDGELTLRRWSKRQLSFATEAILDDLFEDPATPRATALRAQAFVLALAKRGVGLAPRTTWPDAIASLSCDAQLGPPATPFTFNHPPPSTRVVEGSLLRKPLQAGPITARTFAASYSNAATRTRYERVANEFAHWLTQSDRSHLALRLDDVDAYAADLALERSAAGTVHVATAVLDVYVGYLLTGDLRPRFRPSHPCVAENTLEDDIVKLLYGANPYVQYDLSEQLAEQLTPERGREHAAAISSTPSKPLAEPDGARTERAYRADLRVIRTYLAKRGIEGVLPLDPQVVADLVEYESSGDEDSGTPPRSHRTIRRRLWAIRTAHRSRGFADPTTAECVRAAIAASEARTTRSAKRSSAAPALPDAHGVASTHRERRDKALTLIAAAAGLSRLQLAALDIDDLGHTDEGLVITTRTSRRRITLRPIFIPRAAAGPCPVDALIGYVDHGEITEGPVFRRIRAGDRLTTDRLTHRGVAFALSSVVARQAQ